MLGIRGRSSLGYDPARGATFDTDVEIVPTPGIDGGKLETITHVSGSVDCGYQTPGTSTVVASGASAEGAITGGFTTFRVICNASAADGNSLNVVAVIGTTTPPVYLIIALPTNGNATIFTISDNPQKQHSYTVDPAGTRSVTATGGHLDADFNEVVAAGSTEPPHVVHLAGDVTCGTFNKS